jgi:hypothetical protein
MYHVINIQTHYHGEIAEKIKNCRILLISLRFLTEIRLPHVRPHPLLSATELSVHSAEFGATTGDFFNWRPASVACSSGG